MWLQKRLLSWFMFLSFSRRLFIRLLLCPSNSCCVMFSRVRPKVARNALMRCSRYSGDRSDWMMIRYPMVVTTVFAPVKTMYPSCSFVRSWSKPCSSPSWARSRAFSVSQLSVMVPICWLYWIELLRLAVSPNSRRYVKSLPSAKLRFRWTCHWACGRARGLRIVSTNLVIRNASSLCKLPCAKTSMWTWPRSCG